MKAVLISEKHLNAKVIEYDGSYEQLKQILLDDSDGRCDCLDAQYRTIDGEKFVLYIDDEGLFHGYNFTGVCTDYGEILKGPILVVRTDEEGNDVGLTDEQCEKVLAEFKPISPELARTIVKNTQVPQLIMMMGSSALHYTL